jgi:hypothetical protein
LQEWIDLQGGWYGVLFIVETQPLGQEMEFIANISKSEFLTVILRSERAILRSERTILLNLNFQPYLLDLIINSQLIKNLITKISPLASQDTPMSFLILLLNDLILFPKSRDHYSLQYSSYLWFYLDLLFMTNGKILTPWFMPPYSWL